jgi:hypothetical protein
MRNEYIILVRQSVEKNILFIDIFIYIKMNLEEIGYEGVNWF